MPDDLQLHDRAARRAPRHVAKARNLTPTFEDCLRATLGIVALLVVGYLAIFGNPQIAPLAAGALISLLGAAVSYMFRSKLAVSAESPTDPLTLRKG